MSFLGVLFLSALCDCEKTSETSSEVLSGVDRRRSATWLLFWLSGMVLTHFFLFEVAHFFLEKSLSDSPTLSEIFYAQQLRSCVYVMVHSVLAFCALTCLDRAIGGPKPQRATVRRERR